MGLKPGQGKVESGSWSASGNPEPLWSLQCRVRNAEYQEIAAALLDYHRDALEKSALEALEKVVAEKPKFGYWAVYDAEYDRDYSLAMALGRLQVFKGSVRSDRAQYRLARRLNRDHPTLVGLNMFDYRRQFIVFLSSKARALRRFALVELAKQENPERTILL